jgi:hypothetical protein
MRLGLRFPSVFRRKLSGWRSLAVRRVAAQGGNDPAPANYAQLLGGRGPLGLPGGPNGPKNGLLFGQLRPTEFRANRSRPSKQTVSMVNK